MAILKKKIDAGNGVMVPIEIDSTWDEDTLDLAVEHALQAYFDTANTKKAEARAVTEEVRNTKKEFADADKAQRAAEMTHLNSSQGPNYTPEWERARAKTFGETFLPLVGAEMSELGQKIRMGWNAATFDEDDYQKLLTEYRQMQRDIQPLDETHPGVSVLARSTPYMLPSSWLAKTTAKAPYNLLMKTMPKSLRTTPVFPQVPATIEKFLNGQGPMAPLVNTIKPLNAALSRATTYPDPESITAGVLKTLNKPGVQGAALGGTLGALDPDKSALGGAAEGLAMAGLVRTALAPISKSPKYLTKSQRAAVEAADDLGIYLDPGTRTGDPFKEKLSKMFRDDPIASPIVAQIDNSRSQHINRQIGKYFGMVDDTPELNADVLARIEETLNKRLNDYSKMSTPVITAKHVKQLKAIRDKQVLYSGGEETGPIVKEIDAILYMAGIGGKKRWGKLTPEQLQDKRTAIRLLADPKFNAKQGLPQEGRDLVKIQHILDDVLEKGVPQKVRAQVGGVIKDTRKKRAQFAILQQATDKNSGKVSLTKLYDTMVGSPTARNTRYKFLRNEDLFTSLARIGRLEAETRAKMDLSTRNTIGAFLHEGRPVYTKLAANAVSGINGLPSNVLKRGVANFYFNPSGWPSATGFAPIFGKESGERLNKIITRASLPDQPGLNDWFPDVSSIWE